MQLRIRSLRDDDLTDLAMLIDNCEVARWTSSVPYPYTEADRRTWIAGLPRSFTVTLKKTDRVIGGVGLDGSAGDESEEPALGYWVGQPYWGTGMDAKLLPLSSTTDSGSSAL